MPYRKKELTRLPANRVEKSSTWLDTGARRFIWACDLQAYAAAFHVASERALAAGDMAIARVFQCKRAEAHCLMWRALAGL